MSSSQGHRSLLPVTWEISTIFFFSKSKLRYTHTHTPIHKHTCSRSGGWDELCRHAPRMCYWAFISGNQERVGTGHGEHQGGGGKTAGTFPGTFPDLDLSRLLGHGECGMIAQHSDVYLDVSPSNRFSISLLQTFIEHLLVLCTRHSNKKP